jgi:3-dehydroquinate synthase
MSPSVELIRVELGPRSYEIEIGTGNLRQLGSFVLQRAKVTHAVVIADENVAQTHAVSAVESLHDSGVRVDLVKVESGESSKSVAMADVLWRALAQTGADRKTLVVAVGGGVIGDLAGFIAATYMRGLRFVQIPTTLLAQVDSSVGGKVGVNLPTAKNMVGAFWQPLGVLIDTAVLTTLPPREYAAGLAEVVKYGVILDEEFFAYLEQSAPALNQRDSEALRRVVMRSCQLKAGVVEQDEREESGVRAVLNYGHTFAHAFEAVTHYGSLLHGEAVAIGMMCAARLARALGRIPQELVDRQDALLRALHLTTSVPSSDVGEILNAMRRDKKVEHGSLRFVLPARLGYVELVGNISEEEIKRSFVDGL